MAIVHLALEPIIFELIDATTQENVFTNHLFSTSDVKIIDTGNNRELTHVFISENNKNHIKKTSVGREIVELTLAIKTANKTIFTLFVNAERILGDCCTFTKYKEISIQDASFELGINTGVYKVIIN